MKYIKSIIIRNSSFFENDLKIDFSERLSCIMGGRGTGKSTILYFIKSALETDAEDQDRTLYSILKNNLNNGEINITFEEDGDKYEISKSLSLEPQPYLLPGKKHIPFEQLREKFAIDVYPALSIEEIGKNSYDRLFLIDKMLSSELPELRQKVTQIQHNLSQNAQSIRNENSKALSLSENLKNYSTAEDEFKAHVENKPEDIVEKEQKEFEAADQKEKIRNAEKRFVKKIKDKFSSTIEELAISEEDIDSFVNTNADIERFTNKDLLGLIRDEMSKALKPVVSSSKKNQRDIAKSLEQVETLQVKLKAKHDKQENEFVQLRQKFEKHKNYYNKYNALTKKIEEQKVLLKELDEINTSRSKLRGIRNKLLKELNDLKQEVFDKRKAKVALLNAQFNGDIRIVLNAGGITDEYEDLLRNGLKGSNMKYNVLIPNIVANIPPDLFAGLVHKKDADTLKQIPGIDEERSKSIINALFETEICYKIEELYCEDLPEFLLKIDAKDKKDKKEPAFYKKTEELSTGQRCTAVLPIIFAVSDNPLIIDQPEDNLDNKYITETIHRIIREQKAKRQLIFITHNPNVPVLSDSEANIFLNYDEGKSKVEQKGTIRDVKSRILNLLEGGKEAFVKRKELYGEEI